MIGRSNHFVHWGDDTLHVCLPRLDLSKRRHVFLNDKCFQCSLKSTVASRIIIFCKLSDHGF